MFYLACPRSINHQKLHRNFPCIRPSARPVSLGFAGRRPTYFTAIPAILGGIVYRLIDHGADGAAPGPIHQGRACVSSCEPGEVIRERWLVNLQLTARRLFQLNRSSEMTLEDPSSVFLPAAFRCGSRGMIDGLVLLDRGHLYSVKARFATRTPARFKR